MTQDQWHKLFSVNVDSAFFVTKHAISRMIRQNPPGGMIIFNSSIGEEGLPGQANYAASKRAMEGLAEVAAREYASRNIYTSIIRPGFVETELTTNLKPEQRQAILALSPAGRPFTPEEIARGITYLATLKESGHIMNVF
jgi:3-oxoacyl-[acyl-carrier protein] reductase